MKESIKSKIKFYLTEKQTWTFGGTIEDFIRQTDGHKASNASRRCRELEAEEVIESRYITIPGVPNKVVQYRIRQNDVVAWIKPPKTSQPLYNFNGELITKRAELTKQRIV